MPSTIRGAQGYDLNAVADLLVVCDVDRSFVGFRNELQRQLQRDPELFLVAQEDGDVVGALVASFDGRQVWVSRLAVHPGRRREGIGRQLLERLLQRMQEQGLPRQPLSVVDDSEEGRRFFADAGWSEGRPVRSFWMELPADTSGDADPRDVLESFRRVAVIGASTNPAKAAHTIPERLQHLGFRVLPVHPTAKEVLGVPTVRELRDLPEPPQVVDVFRPAEEAPEIARQAVEVGAKVLWLQTGITSPDAREIAREGGLAYLEDRCMATEAERLGVRKIS